MARAGQSLLADAFLDDFLASDFFVSDFLESDDVVSDFLPSDLAEVEDEDVSLDDSAVDSLELGDSLELDDFDPPDRASFL